MFSKGDQSNITSDQSEFSKNKQSGGLGWVIGRRDYDQKKIAAFNSHKQGVWWESDYISISNQSLSSIMYHFLFGNDWSPLTWGSWLAGFGAARLVDTLHRHTLTLKLPIKTYLRKKTGQRIHGWVQVVCLWSKIHPGSRVLIIHTRVFLSSFGCIMMYQTLTTRLGGWFRELPTRPWRLAEQRSNRQTDRTSPHLRPWSFWRDIFLAYKPYWLNPQTLVNWCQLLADVKDVWGSSLHSSWPTKPIWFQKDSAKFGPDMELPYVAALWW